MLVAVSNLQLGPSSRNMMRVPVEGSKQIALRLIQSDAATKAAPGISLILLKSKDQYVNLYSIVDVILWSIFKIKCNGSSTD